MPSSQPEDITEAVHRNLIFELIRKIEARDGTSELAKRQLVDVLTLDTPALSENTAAALTRILVPESAVGLVASTEYDFKVWVSDRPRLRSVLPHGILRYLKSWLAFFLMYCIRDVLNTALTKRIVIRPSLVFRPELKSSTNHSQQV